MRSTDPVIPQIASGLRVEPATAALLSTAFTLPYALVQPLLGALADMFSKARLMLLCLLVVAVATLACGLAPNFEMLMARARGRRACRRRRGADRLCAGRRQRPDRAAAGGDGPPAVRDHDRQSAGRDRRRRDRRSGRLARRVLRHRRFSAPIVLAAAVPGFRGFDRSARPLRSLDAGAELSRDLQQSAGEDLFRRGVPRGAVHVRRVSLHRDHAARRRRDPRLDRRHRASPASASAARSTACWCRGCWRWLGETADDADRRHGDRLLPAA